MRRSARRTPPWPASSCFFDWKWSDAEQEYKHVIALSPSSAKAHHWYGVLLTFAGRFREARSELARALDLDPLSLMIKPNRYGPDTRPSMRSGDRPVQKGPRGEDSRHPEERAKAEYVPASAFADIYRSIGETDQAFQWLKKMVEEHDPRLVELRVSPDFDKWPSDPRFAGVLKTVGLDR
jgi:tetratricopeptide (TPR) repeat protein